MRTPYPLNVGHHKFVNAYSAFPLLAWGFEKAWNTFSVKKVLNKFKTNSVNKNPRLGWPKYRKFLNFTSKYGTMGKFKRWKIDSHPVTLKDSENSFAQLP